jgi:hypothetical protein
MRPIPQWRPWYEVICDLCGMVAEFDLRGSTDSWPTRCEANAGGRHYPPMDHDVVMADSARRARELWLELQYQREGRK